MGKILSLIKNDINHHIPYIQDVPEKTHLSEKGSYLTKGRFFWDTLYLGKLMRTLESLIYLLVIPDNNPSHLKISLWYPIRKSLY